MYKLPTVHVYALWPLGHCTCTRYIDSIQTMVIFKYIQSGISYWGQREPRLQSSRNVPLGCLYNIIMSSWRLGFMSDIIFQGGQFGTKWIICILRAPYHSQINSEKFIWMGLAAIALTDGFHFQTGKTSNFWTSKYKAKMCENSFSDPQQKSAHNEIFEFDNLLSTPWVLSKIFTCSIVNGLLKVLRAYKYKHWESSCCSIFHNASI